MVRGESLCAANWFGAVPPAILADDSLLLI